MRSIRIRNPNTAPSEDPPLNVWLEPNGGSQVNLWVGNDRAKQVVARLQLGTFRGDVHLRLARIDPYAAQATGISTEHSLGTDRTHISVNKE